MSKLSPAADVFWSGTGIHTECGIRHSQCQCWNDVAPYDEDDEDDEYEEEDDE